MNCLSRTSVTVTADNIEEEFDNFFESLTPQDQASIIHDLQHRMNRKRKETPT